MEKETAEMYERRLFDWTKQKKILDAQEPQIPSLRLSSEVSVSLLLSPSSGISIDFQDIDGFKRYTHLDYKEAIDLAHFIIELFGDKYSPG